MVQHRSSISTRRTVRRPDSNSWTCWRNPAPGRRPVFPGFGASEGIEHIEDIEDAAFHLLDLLDRLDILSADFAGCLSADGWQLSSAYVGPSGSVARSSSTPWGFTWKVLRSREIFGRPLDEFAWICSPIPTSRWRCDAELNKLDKDPSAVPFELLRPVSKHRR